MCNWYQLASEHYHPVRPLGNRCPQHPRSSATWRCERQTCAKFGTGLWFVACRRSAAVKVTRVRHTTPRSLDGAKKGLPTTTLNHPDPIDTLVMGTDNRLDHGKNGGRVAGPIDNGVLAEVSSIRPTGAKIKHGKGANLPGVEVDLPAPTDKDLRDRDSRAAQVVAGSPQILRSHQHATRPEPAGRTAVFVRKRRG